MNPVALVLFLVAAGCLLSLPRRTAIVPLIAGTCCIPLGAGIDVGPFSFPVFRLLILVGFLRVVLRGERPAGTVLGMDKVLALWAGWFVVCSAFHQEPAVTVITHLGLVFNTVGTYILLRCLCHTEEDIRRFVQILALVLLPVAVEMVMEQVLHRNLFSIFGGVPESPIVRNGRLRSQGPFGHPILAGTVGGASFPLMFGIWRSHPRSAKLGLAACAAIVICSASSGPIMSVAFGAFALTLWFRHQFVPVLRTIAVLGYFLAEVVMNDPAYYLLARIDLTGSSAGYHRAALIQSAITNLSDWWFAGTDYTRHWMPYGVSWSEDHADITNHYIGQGVKGGLPLMMLFIVMIGFGFRYVRVIVDRTSSPCVAGSGFLVWAVGASLFAHAASLISVAYFDQCVFFLYANLAIATSLRAHIDSAEGVLQDEALPEDAQIDAYGPQSPANT